MRGSSTFDRAFHAALAGLTLAFVGRTVLTEPTKPSKVEPTTKVVAPVEPAADFFTVQTKPDFSVEGLTAAHEGPARLSLRPSVSSTGVPGHVISELDSLLAKNDASVRHLSQRFVKKDSHGEYVELVAKRPMSPRQRAGLASRVKRKLEATGAKDVRIRVVNPRAGGGVPGNL